MKRQLVFAPILMGALLHAQWSSVGGGTNFYPNALYWDAVEQRLYYAGDASHAMENSLVINGISYFISGSWYPMGSGSTPYPGGTGSYPVGAVTRFDSSIVVAGAFPWMDSVPGTWGVAQWRADEWLSTGLDSGTFEQTSLVTNLTVLDGKLQVLGGMNWELNGSSVDSWAVWDGQEWDHGDTTGLFAGGQINQVCDFQGMRYVGGNFQPTGQPNDLVRWNGTQWEEVGGGINGDPWVNEMVVYDDRLWVCGEFAASAGNAATGLMAWDGTSWADPFPQITFTAAGKDVIAANGKLYFTGPFVAQGLSGIYRFGVFDGETLCVFGGPDVFNSGTIAASADTFYAYCVVPGLELNNVAQWPLDAPSDTCYTVVQGFNDETQEPVHFSLYPNPGSEMITVRLSRALPSHGARVLFADVMGRTVLLASVRSAEGLISIAELPSGVYRAVLQDENGRWIAATTFVRP